MLKFASDARGAFLGKRAWIKAFSLSDSHFADDGTVSFSRIPYVRIKKGLTIWQKEISTEA